MVWSSLFIGLFLGALVGALVMHLWQRGKAAAVSAQFELQRQQNVGQLLMQVAEKEQALRLGLEQHERERLDLQQRLRDLVSSNDERTRELVQLNGELASEQQRSRGLTDKLNEQKGELEKLNERMTSEFKLIANQLLEDKGKQLNERQKETLEGLLNPFKERITEFQKQVQEAYQNEGKERHLLKSEVAKLVEQNQQLSKDAISLTKALKGDSKTQGDWGEMVLEKHAGRHRPREGPGVQHAGQHHQRRRLPPAAGCGHPPAGRQAPDHRCQGLAHALRALQRGRGR